MKVEFRIDVTGSGAALEDDPKGEVVRMLKDVASAIEHGRESGILRDINGNRAGTWWLDINEEG